MNSYWQLGHVTLEVCFLANSSGIPDDIKRAIGVNI